MSARVSLSLKVLLEQYVTDRMQFVICLKSGSTWQVLLKGSFNLPLPVNGEKYRHMTQSASLYT